MKGYVESYQVFNDMAKTVKLLLLVDGLPMRLLLINQQSLMNELHYRELACSFPLCSEDQYITILGTLIYAYKYKLSIYVETAGNYITHCTLSII